MGKRVNQKKRAQRLLILAVGGLCSIVLIGLLVSFFISALGSSGKKETNNQEKQNEVKTVATVVAKDKADYKKYKVDESGRVPIMMYHGIRGDIKSKDTGNTGGNVDADGYTRTADAFEKDLEKYYKEGFRMIRLHDYINGRIDVDAGKSPIILTFDDGNANNIKVKGKDKNGDLIIDEKSAVGIMEKFKEEYPDSNITATFFINGAKFNQPEYDDEIIQWLVDHGYDVGNHTKNHPYLTDTTAKETEEEVGYVYNMLDEIIPKKYVKIVALPYGMPYQFDHDNMEHVLKATYKGKTYKTESAMQVSWEPDESPFGKDFHSVYLKRVRAYDNNGQMFDIESTFELLKVTKYVSDGDVDTIVVPKEKKKLLAKKYRKEAKTYTTQD